MENLITQDANTHSHATFTLSLEKLLQALSARSYRFITVTPTTHALVNRRPGNTWARNLQDVFGWNRPFEPQLLDAELFNLLQQASLLKPVSSGWQSRVRVSSIGDVLFAHSAFPTAETDAVFFGPDTYRYIRAMEHTLPSLPEVKRAVDIGTGSGAGAILLAQARPEAEVWGIDINSKALDFSQANARANGVTNVHFKYSNLLHDLEGEFDLVIANPPYLVDPSERAYRHGSGPLGAQLSLDIVDAALTRLSVGGSLLLYTGVAIMQGEDPFLQAVQQKIKQAGARYQYTEIDPDIFAEELHNPPYDQADRIAAVWCQVTRT